MPQLLLAAASRPWVAAASASRALCEMPCCAATRACQPSRRRALALLGALRCGPICGSPGGFSASPSGCPSQASQAICRISAIDSSCAAAEVEVLPERLRRVERQQQPLGGVADVRRSARLLARGEQLAVLALCSRGADQLAEQSVELARAAVVRARLGRRRAVEIERPADREAQAMLGVGRAAGALAGERGQAGDRGGSRAAR